MENQKVDNYFSNGKYDIYKSEKRRKEIKQQHSTTKRKIPYDVSVEDYLIERDKHCQDVAHNMMFKIFNQSKS